ncbi:MAG: S41 family peptidase [Flammeovirgaceae bacterium]
MNYKSLFLTLMALVSTSLAFGQIDARMFQNPDVSENQIVFTYAGDIWVVSKNGGLANKLSSPKGSEMFAKFSPDGKTIAFSANYDGNSDVYTIPVTGGIPSRITYHSGFDRLVDWHPTGDKVLFSSSRESGRQRFNQFYAISTQGGVAEKLPMPYGDFGAYSADGKQLVFNYQSRVFRTWKRYKGGAAPDLFVFDLDKQTSRNITNNIKSDEYPMWSGDKIYYLSDNGPNQRYNIWVYDTKSKKNKQVTTFKEYDIHFPSIGPKDIVFEAGGKLYLMDLASQKYKEVKVQVITDQANLAPRRVAVKDLLSWGDISPDGKRIIATARGEVFSVPVENGVTKNLTSSSGAAERFATWSPNGKYIAYWSDKTGEYQLTLLDLETNQEKALTSYKSGYKYQLYWSPDSKKLAFVDQTMDINYFDMESNKTVKMDKGMGLFHGGLSGFTFSWSSDSKWITYSRSLENNHNAIFIYDIAEQKRHQVTSGYYNDANPTFDPDGKYLYLSTGRNFSPSYSDIDATFIYPNSTQLAVITLRKDIASPLAPKNDEVAIKADEKKDDDKKEGEKKDDDKKKDEDKGLKIDLEGFEERLVVLPVPAGNYGGLEAVSGKLVFQHYPNTGSANRQSTLKFYDVKAREAQTIVENAGGFELAANGKKIAVFSRGNIYVVNVAPSQKLNKPVDLSNMYMVLNPKEEWRQIFTDAWRLERDFFYDKNMHGVNWEAQREKYGAMIENAVTRADVNYVLGELIGELNASHTYRGGGDTERSSYSNVGYLGVDWELSNGYYKIAKIIKGAVWDSEVRSPFAQPGVQVKEGDYLLAVNGIPVDSNKEVFAAFQGMAGETVELTINSSATMEGAKSIIVKTLRSESRLRHLAWIEANRKRVEEATDGRIGYIYVRSTGIDGQNELVRQFAAQFNKDGLIIDERFNSGGQIPDRFVELLNRKPLAYWAVRDGKDWQWPVFGNFGPKAMLINGWSGSGGDAFPDYFRKAGLGKLIGTRTWGGLIGISGAPQLIDGGTVTVPTFRMYDPDGKWFKEGHGVDPDIEVKENPGELSKGTDGQLEKAIEWIKEELKKYKGKPDHAPYDKM